MNLKHLDKNNLHHAYLIEGEHEIVLPEVLEFIESLGVRTEGNPDFSHIRLDSLKVEDARNLKMLSGEKGTVLGKRIFLISTNNFLLDAQNALLKMFEEPIDNTHFFIILRDRNSLLKTLLSRLYLIESDSTQSQFYKDAEDFLKMTPQNRINFIKDLLVEVDEDEEGVESMVLESARAKALQFLNALEVVLHNNFSSKNLERNFADSSLPEVSGGSHTTQNFFQDSFLHIFNVRKFLRMPGSSAKNLMESVAIVIPNFID